MKEVGKFYASEWLPFLLICFLMLISPVTFSHHYKMEWDLGNANVADVGRNKTSWRWCEVFHFTNWHFEVLWLCFLSHLDDLSVGLDNFVIKMSSMSSVLLLFSFFGVFLPCLAPLMGFMCLYGTYPADRSYIFFCVEAMQWVTK